MSDNLNTELKPGKIYRRKHKRGNVTTQTLCKVLEQTETGWLVDLGTGEQAEIEPEKAAEMEEV